MLLNQLSASVYFLLSCNVLFTLDAAASVGGFRHHQLSINIPIAPEDI